MNQKRRHRAVQIAQLAFQNRAQPSAFRCASPAVTSTTDNAIGRVIDDSRCVVPKTGISPSIARNRSTLSHSARLNLTSDPSNTDESVQRWIHRPTFHTGEQEHLVAGERLGVQRQNSLHDSDHRRARLTHLGIVPPVGFGRNEFWPYGLVGVHFAHVGTLPTVAI